MEQKLSDTLVKIIDRSNPMMQNLQLASRFNKLIEEGGGSSQTTITELSVTANGTYDAGNNAAYNPVTVNVPSGGGEDKLLCYYLYNGRTNCCVVYTDKPARKIYAGVVNESEQAISPVDNGGHLFITNIDLALMIETNQYVDISYMDGTSADLKGKFIKVSE